MTGKEKKHLLIILGAVLALILAGAGGVLLWQRWTPAQIGNKYRLEDLEPGQAVMAIRVRSLRRSYLVIDSRGRWKHVYPHEEWDDETRQWFRQREYYPQIELCDLLLENDKLPYGKGRVPRKLLEWAVNMESAVLKSIPEENEEPTNAGCVPHIVSNYEYWAIAGTGKERKKVLLREEKWDGYVGNTTLAWSDDIRVALMCNTLDLLMGDESALRKKHFLIGLCIAFVLLLVLIAGTWFRRRKVSRNREETE